MAEDTVSQPASHQLSIGQRMRRVWPYFSKARGGWAVAVSATLLASATEHQLECAREMAAYITPRAGATAHPLTINAAADMVSMVERAIHFRGTPPK